MSVGLAVITRKDKLPKYFFKNLGFIKQKVVKKIDSIKDFSKERNAILSQFETDWIFFLDDDEYVSKELSEEIKKVVKSKNISGVYFKRHDICFYQVLKRGELKGQKFLRLARKNSGLFKRPVHETWQINGHKKTLNNPLYHQKDSFVTEFIGRVSFYGPIDAVSLINEGKDFSYISLIFLPVLKFIYSYFINTGFNEGYPGLFLSYLMSVQSLSVRIFQWEKKQK